MRNPFARLAKRDTARPSLRDRAAALKVSAASVIRRKPIVAEDHPDAALLAAADMARPFIAREGELEAECERMSALTDQLAVERFGPRPDPRTDLEGMKAYDEKLETLRHETGRNAAWAAMANNNGAIWDLLGPFTDQPAKTLEGAAAKAALAASNLWDADYVAREVAALFYGCPVETHAPPFRFEPSTPIPDFFGMSATDLRRTYDAFKLATDMMAMASETVPEEGAGRRLLEAETERLVSFQHSIADELERLQLSDRKDAGECIDVLVARALACRDFKEVAHFAAEATANDL